jgi:uncharacterized BrkB/YihY/UPF0761 family membrane protein
MCEVLSPIGKEAHRVFEPIVFTEEEMLVNSLGPNRSPSSWMKISISVLVTAIIWSILWFLIKRMFSISPSPSIDAVIGTMPVLVLVLFWRK